MRVTAVLAGVLFAAALTFAPRVVRSDPTASSVRSTSALTVTGRVGTPTRIISARADVPLTVTGRVGAPARIISARADVPLTVTGRSGVGARAIGCSGCTFRNWSEVPGGGRTNGTGPATASYGAVLYLFVAGADGRLFANRFDGQSWSLWNEVPGGAHTQSEPAAVTFERKLYLFARGADDRIFVNVNDLSSRERWSGWTEVGGGGKTTTGLAAAVLQGGLHLFAVGAGENAQRLFFNVYDRSGWGRWKEVEPTAGRSSSTPAVTVRQEKLHLIVRATDGTAYTNVLAAGRWATWKPMPADVRLGGGPGAATCGDWAMSFVTDPQGRSHHCFFPRSSDPNQWSNWSVVPGDGRAAVSASPAAAVVGGELFLFVTGTENRIFFNVCGRS